MAQVACGTYSYCAGSEGNQPVNHLSWDEVKTIPSQSCCLLCVCVLLSGAEHVLIKAPGLEPLNPPPPGLLQNLQARTGGLGSLWTICGLPVS